ncbi:hypothetical protein VPH35_064078 [Triticum aestivum]
MTPATSCRCCRPRTTLGVRQEDGNNVSGLSPMRDLRCTLHARRRRTCARSPVHLVPSGPPATSLGRDSAARIVRLGAPPSTYTIAAPRRGTAASRGHTRPVSPVHGGAMGWSGLVDTHRSTRRTPFYLHHRRRLGEAPPHREVSFVVVLPVHGGAMDWPGLADRVRSTRRGGAELDESRRLVVTMEAAQHSTSNDDSS